MATKHPVLAALCLACLIPVAAFSESGAETVSAIQRDVGGVKRLDLTLRVVDGKSCYARSVLLSAADTKAWISGQALFGGFLPKAWVLRQYAAMLDTLDLAVARYKAPIRNFTDFAGETIGSMLSASPDCVNTSIDPKKAQGYVSIIDLRTERAAIAAANEQLPELIEPRWRR